MSYADQLRRPNCYRQNNGRARHDYKIDENNNNNNNNNNLYTNQNTTHFKFERNANDFAEHSKYNSGCFKINNQSRGVKKSKTPAQDRLQKWVSKNKSVVAESFKECVNIKSSVSNVPKFKALTTATHVPKLKSVIVKCTDVDSVESKKVLESKGSIVTDVNERGKAIEKPLSDLSNFLPLPPLKFSLQNQMQSFQANLSTSTVKKHYDTQVQSHLKINDKSKAIGVKKMKSRAPAQDRLQKWADNYKTTMFESIKDLVDMPTGSLDAKNPGKLIGMQKSHVTGIEPSITQVVGKTATVTNMADSAFIIPDTNVFLHSLACIKMVIEKDLKYKILIPYVVLQELDNLKRRRGENSFTLKLNATRAIRYIYELIQAENKRLQGQTAIEDTNRLIDVRSNDDKILNCCLQLIGQSKDVILVTNDLNLTNIAKLSGVNAISFKACLQRYQ